SSRRAAAVPTQHKAGLQWAIRAVKACIDLSPLCRDSRCYRAGLLPVFGVTFARDEWTEVRRILSVGSIDMVSAALVSRIGTWPLPTWRAANRHVVPCRLYSWVTVPQRPRFKGKPSCERVQRLD